MQNPRIVPIILIAVLAVNQMGRTILSILLAELDRFTGAGTDGVIVYASLACSSLNGLEPLTITQTLMLGSNKPPGIENFRPTSQPKSPAPMPVMKVT